MGIDVVVVTVAVLDNWILSIALDSGEVNLKSISVLRLLRLSRLLRMFKIIKMRKDMRVLIEGMTGAFRSLIPIGIMLSVGIYAMALVCLDSIKPEFERLSAEVEDV